MPQELRGLGMAPVLSWGPWEKGPKRPHGGKGAPPWAWALWALLEPYGALCGPTVGPIGRYAGLVQCATLRCALYTALLCNCTGLLCSPKPEPEPRSGPDPDPEQA